MLEKAFVTGILEDLSRISTHPLLTPKPKNLISEKIKFLNNPKYNPQFTYYTTSDLSIEKGQIEDIITKIYHYKLNKNLEVYLVNLANYIFNLCVLNESLGKDNLFNAALKKVYNWDLNLTQDFDKMIDCLPDDLPKELNAQDIKKEMDNKLKSYKLTEWKSSIVDDRSSVSVNFALKSIRIGSEVRKSILGLRKLIIHEIESHLIRYINSLESPYKIVQAGNFPSKIQVEEGFAIFNEYQNNALTKEDLQNYINRFNLCQSKASFSQIYENCINELEYTQDKAFETVYRLKRGFADTASEFIHLKDSAYLKGFDILLKNIESKEDYIFLFNGRITLQEKFLENYGVFDYNSILPIWFRDLKFQSRG